MFNNELMADVHFVVGPPGASKKVPAHKVGAADARCFPFLLPALGQHTSSSLSLSVALSSLQSNKLALVCL